MTAVPVAPLLLGLAGLLPFLWSVATYLSPGLAGWAGAYLPPMYLGGFVGLTYGTIILSFMSGVLWGFATRAEPGTAGPLYALSVIPALWVFFMVGDATSTARIYLIAGFLGLLGIDHSFARLGLTPPWWMRLRVLLTAIVVACLAVPLLL